MPLLSAVASVILPLLQVDHAVVLEKVYLNGHGPFRMLFDTGAQSSLITPEVARRINAEPRFRVEHATLAGARLVPGTFATIRTAETEQPDVEVIISELPAARRLAQLDGVLGQSWLSRFDYLIDLNRGQLILDGETPPGTRMPLLLEDDRPAILLKVNGESNVGVFDSGTPVTVLFRSELKKAMVSLVTNVGIRAARSTQAELTVGSFRAVVDAVVVPGHAAALLPLRSFGWVFVSNRNRFVILGSAPR